MLKVCHYLIHKNSYGLKICFFCFVMACDSHKSLTDLVVLHMLSLYHSLTKDGLNRSGHFQHLKEQFNRDLCREQTETTS